jgi:hypothetical protein
MELSNCGAWRPGYAGLTTNTKERERESPGIEGLSRSRSFVFVVPPKAAARPRVCKALVFTSFTIFPVDARGWGYLTTCNSMALHGPPC